MLQRRALHRHSSAAYSETRGQCKQEDNTKMMITNRVLALTVSKGLSFGRNKPANPLVRDLTRGWSGLDE